MALLKAAIRQRRLMSRRKLYRDVTLAWIVQYLQKIPLRLDPFFRTNPQKTEAPIIDRMVRSLSQVSAIELSQERKAAILARQEQVQEKHP